LIGDFSDSGKEQIKWKTGGLTNCGYTVASGSGLTADSGKNGTLRVFFVSNQSTAHISEAYFHDSTGQWELKTLL
jgi:hypothetical protein